MPWQGADASSEFCIFEAEEFQNRFSKLPADREGILRRKIDEFVYPQLRKDPFLGLNIKKLRGYEPEIWRYRIGRYRVFYLIDQEEHMVSMLSVDDRRDAYR